MPRKTEKPAKRAVHALTAVRIATVSPELESPPLRMVKVGELADQLAAIAPDAAHTTERLRHWTREHLITPIEQHHAGTGKHRGYDGSVAPYEAAVLLVLANAGLSLVSRPYLQDALAHVRNAGEKWRRARSAGRKVELFLEVAHPAGLEPVAYLHEGRVEPTAWLSIIIDLVQLFEQVRASPWQSASAPGAPDR
jgi:hypothetical protein